MANAPFVSFGVRLIILILAGDLSVTLRIGQFAEKIVRNPGLVVQGREEYLSLGYQEAFRSAFEEILQENKVRFDYSGNTSTLLWSAIRYRVNQFTMVGYEQPTSSVSLTKAKGFLVNMSLPVVKFKGKYTLDFFNGPWFQYNRRGAIIVTILGTTLEFIKEMTLNEKRERASYTSTNCSASIKDIVVDLQDPLSNTLIAGIKWDEEIRLYQERFCRIIKCYTTFERDLSLNVTNEIYIDLTLQRESIFYDGYVEDHFIAEVRYRGDAKRFGRLPQPQLLKRPSGLVVYRMSDFVFNSFGDVVHNHKLLSFRYTQLDLPENRKHLLDTTCELECFGKLFPNASAMWPASSVEISVTTSEAPYVLITSDSFKVIFGFNIEAYARVTSDSAPRIFSVHLFMSALVVPSIKNNRIRFERQHEDANITVIDSRIGDLREDDLRVVINQALQKVVDPLEKQFTVDGIDLDFPPWMFIDQYEFNFTDGNLSLLISSVNVKERKSYVDLTGNQQTLTESVEEFFSSTLPTLTITAIEFFSSILPTLTTTVALCIYLTFKLRWFADK